MDPPNTVGQVRSTVRRKRSRSLSRSISASLSRRGILPRSSEDKVDFPSQSEPTMLSTSISDQPTHMTKSFFQPPSDDESDLHSLGNSQGRRKGSVVWHRTTLQSDNSIVNSVTVVEPKTKWNRTHFSLEHIDDLAFYLQIDKQQIDEIQTDIDQVRERQEAKRLSARFDKLQLDRLDEQLFEDRMEDILHKHSPLVRAKRRSTGPHLRTHRSKSLSSTVDRPITQGLARQTMWELCDLSDLQLLQELGRDRNTILWKAHIGQSSICAKQILDPTPERMEQLREHVRLMRECAHPNIVTHYGVGSDQSKQQFFVFAELIEESLVDVISRHKAMSEGVAAIVVYQVLSALTHIHSQGFTHGALKPTKILVNQNGVVKLSDFQVSPERREPLPRYTAPEILRGNVYLEVSDSWSVGCLLVYLLTGKAPYPDMKSYELMSILRGKQPLRPSMPPKISADCAAFLKLCWEQASERCDAATLVTHRFVRHACEDHQSVISYLRAKSPVVPPLQLSFSAGY